MRVIHFLIAMVFVVALLSGCGGTGGTTIQDTQPPGTIPVTVEEETTVSSSR